RHRIYTEKHLKREASWWTDARLIMCGYTYTPDGKRRNTLWFSDNQGVNWSEPYYVEVAYDDAGYGDIFYNPLTEEIVFICYRGEFTKADLVQYNLSVDWGT